MAINKIIIHHTAGTYFANETDKRHYHYLILGDGTIINGRFSPEANIPPLVDGLYAAHTYLGNSNAIGIALCCNYNFDLNNTKATAWPITQVQYNKLIPFIAELMRVYNIKLSNVTTHYWHDKCKGIKQGKVDITYLPWEPSIKPNKIIYKIREDISKLI